MTTKRLSVPLLALLLVAIAFTGAPRADEGFWPYSSIPKAAIKAKYGFEITDAWLNHLQLATVRFGGGTGSIVSPNGLVLTNHHIALGSLQRLSTADKDLVKNGFYAPAYADELKVAGLSLSVLQSIEDVTAKVNAGIASTMTAKDAAAARQKNIQGIQGEPQTGTLKQVVALYAGAIYNLYTYKVYTDVRLVFGPEYQTGFFGGDTDNFTYPRYCLDVGMFRLYENDKPAQTPTYLHFSPAGSKDNELVFTTGHPGSTQRLNTLAHFKYRRDVALPFTIANNEMREAAVKKWMALSAENARQATSELFGIQNSLKSQRGQLKGLQSAALMAQKEASEKRLRAELAKNAAKQAELGDAWDTIEKSLDVARKLDAERNFVANAAGLNSTLFQMARQIGASITAVHVMPVLHMFTYEPGVTEAVHAQVKKEREQHAQKYLELVGQRAAAAGVTCHAVLVTSDYPYEAIVTTARERECDLIAMASHGRRGVKGLLLGSETQRVLTHSAIPVLVYRNGASPAGIHASFLS
ncbi:MAG: S46 family peptidase [Acidobacteria bacterium]|nr:S46 family peptidase [Acidobacteriota bacterium]